MLEATATMTVDGCRGCVVVWLRNLQKSGKNVQRQSIFSTRVLYWVFRAHFTISTDRLFDNRVSSNNRQKSFARGGSGSEKSTP